MKMFLLLCTIFLLSGSGSFAKEESEHKHDKDNCHEYDVRYDELMYTLRDLNQTYQRQIKERDEIIVEMRIKMKELESDVFQTNQRLKNLEMEVWYDEKAVDEK